MVKKATGLMILEVKGANPNGDPDADGMPRQLDDSRGLITAVSVKRKIREIFDIGNDINAKRSPEVQQLISEFKLKEEEFHIFESRQRGLRVDTAWGAYQETLRLAKENPEGFLKRFFDTRVFGTTLLEEGDEEEEKARRVRKRQRKKRRKKGTFIVLRKPGLSRLAMVFR